MIVLESVDSAISRSRSASGRTSTSMRSFSCDLRALVDVGEAGRQEQVHLLVREARRGVEGAERRPSPRPACRSPPPARAWRSRAAPRPPRRACRRGSPAGPARRSPRAAGARTRAPRRRARRSRPRPCGTTISRSAVLAVLVAEDLLADAEERRPRRRSRRRRARSGSSCGGVLGGRGLGVGERGGLVEQRQRHVEHALQGRDGRRARSARGCARCRWRGSRTGSR